ncbi:MAG TPA: methyltransferase domain-containing protein [Steroidobacteraceae bacterium]|nr:methyltransferase domain-containing protein [Steroidobacteraceae bacterium]
MSAVAMGEFPPYKPPVPRFDDGIFVSVDSRHHDGADDEGQLNTLNTVARQQGWRNGVSAAYDRELLHYVDNPDRLIFLSLLPLNPGDAILEIGPGLGQISIPLSRRVATVDALEVVRGQAQFCAERSRQEDARNIRITAGGDNCELPYADASFNGVILNLVLEWCGWRAGGSHDDMHRKLLAEVSRVLKPGGFFYLATKNRFSLRLLTGGRDEHMFQMRFGSALPRWLSRMMLRGRRASGHLHSYRELRGLLRSKGFDRIDSYWATPEMRWPTHMLQFEADDFARERRKVSQGENPRTSAIAAVLPAFMIKHVAPGLAFLARKRAATIR